MTIITNSTYPQVVGHTETETQFRVDLVLGHAQHHIVIDKADGFAPEASVSVNALLWGKLHGQAKRYLKKQFSGEYRWLCLS